MAKRVRAVDLDTGEILDDLIRLEDGEYVGSQKKRDEFDGKKKLPYKKRINHDKSYVMCYQDPIKEITDRLTLVEAGALAKLLTHMRLRGEGKLTRANKPLKNVDIEKIIGRSKPVTSAILAKLVAVGILEKIREGRSNCYRVNPLYHAMGERHTGGTYAKLYTVKAREVFDDLNLSEAGMFWRIIPYFHYRDYCLAFNPNESDPGLIEYVGRGELAEILEMEPDSVSRLVRKLQGMGVMLATYSNRCARYYIHPDLMDRQYSDSKFTWAVREMFKKHGK
jgi:DNA-binding transcriptional regulator GbsR (MarR family)